uniref:Retrovirus-related Pol polyprotein from transposon TNT 1-94 n=1 Tax=Tanacetum cinerariifolium TaxID=118510 RepID=A0A699HH78_TANCI|nr:retrovirus-related Pol polyprotein from transposon TNT 1-94 [Tanacetum cinerariifolium]
MPKCEILEAASDSSVSEIDKDNNQAKDRHKVGIGYHAVPPTYTRNYMPPRADLSFAGLDDYMFKFKINENESITSKSSEEIREEPKTIRYWLKEVRPVWNNARRLNHQNFSKMTHPHPKRNFVPKSVVTKSGQVLVNVANQNSATSTGTARPKVNTTAIRPNVNAKSSYFKPHFPKRRHFNQKSAAKTNTFIRKINTAKGKNVTTDGSKAVVNATEGKKENVVKSSAYWIWRPNGKLIDHTSKQSGSYTLKRFNYGNPQYTLHNQGIFDSGCSRHITGNKSFLTEYQEIDGGFVAFRGSPKGGKITGKGKIRTGKLDFEDVYFVKELKFNIFSVSQISPNLEFMRPFGCLVTILNTLDHLGKFDGKADEGFLVGYSVSSKAFRVFNSRTKKFEENLNVNFLENKPNFTGSGPEWLFDIYSLTKYMNYESVSAGNQSNGDAGIQTNIHAGQASQEKAAVHEYILLPFISSNPPFSSTIQSSYVNVGDKLGDVNAGDIQGDVDEISRNDDV